MADHCILHKIDYPKKHFLLIPHHLNKYQKLNYSPGFLILTAPYRPISPTTAGHHITDCMRKANLKATAYWMRHTYAQNLLEAGASIYEIKEMMGHDRIESTKKYLYIHIKLMRKVLFDEEF